jgi:hypothetical protein
LAVALYFPSSAVDGNAILINHQHFDDHQNIAFV